MTTKERPSAKLELIAEGAFMKSNSELLARTLIQRGESDNYIRERLLTIGLQDDAARELIRESRLDSDTLVSAPVLELEIIFVVFASFALMLLLVWFLLSGLLF
jgi:hypothetical protein